MAEAARAGGAEEAAGGQRLRADLVDGRRSGVALRQPRAARPAGTVWTVFENGPPARRSTCSSSAKATRRRRCRSSKRIVAAGRHAVRHEPFKSRRSDFNVRALDLPSPQSGVNRPNAGVFRRTPLSAEYNIFDSERYVLTLDNRALRDAARRALRVHRDPGQRAHLRRRRHLQRSGDGVGRQRVRRLRLRPRVRPSLRGARRRVLHVGRRLRDRRRGTPKPWEPNVTALARSGEAEVARPGRRPARRCRRRGRRRNSRSTAAASRSAGARSAQRNAPRRRWTRSSASSAREEKLLGGMKYAGKSARSKGPATRPKGLYRPEADCIMFTRDHRIIDLYRSDGVPARASTTDVQTLAIIAATSRTHSGAAPRQIAAPTRWSIRSGFSGSSQIPRGTRPRNRRRARSCRRQAG